LNGEVISQRKDGTTFDATVTVTPIRGDEGGVVNFVTVQHDISALKEVDRLKSQFVSDVSHELRTPLTNIRLYVDLLGEKTMADRAEEYLTTLNRESERLAHLIDDLLSLSRLEAGSAPFEPKPIDINKLLSNLSDDRKALAGEHNIQLTVDTEDDLPPVMGDERLIAQIFTNLLTNAMNYTLEDGEITMRTGRAKREGSEWLVAEVEDTGLGINPDEKPMIFQRFFRGKASQKTGAPGTGLGLAICREIAELHGGQIHLESEEGKGTLVTVWLPLEDHQFPTS
jgi:signal transduction histidine kinase